MRESSQNRISALELELGEAIRMLRLVASNKRTCLEIEDWLQNNYPDDEETDQSIIDDFLGASGKKK